MPLPGFFSDRTRYFCDHICLESFKCAMLIVGDELLDMPAGSAKRIMDNG